MAFSQDTEHMYSALAVAKRGLGRVWPNPSVGCVIVSKEGHVVGRARTADGGRPHAETIALEQAGPEAKGATVYVTLEPCAHHGKTPPCTGALIEADVKRVVIACEDPDPRVSGKGARQLDVAGIAVEVGILQQEAQALNQGFILKTVEDRPLVTLKLAVSVDGKIAASVGERTQITGAQGMQRVHLERSRHDAVMVGVGTVLADDPLLTARLPGLDHDIVRVALDSDLRTPSDGQLTQSVSPDSPLWILHNSKERGKASSLSGAGVKLMEVGSKEPEAVLKILAAEGITRLLIEGGAKVHTSFLKAGFCDRFLLFRSPNEIGDGGVNALEGHDIFNLAQDFGLEMKKSAAFGEDLLEIYEREA